MAPDYGRVREHGQSFGYAVRLFWPGYFVWVVLVYGCDT